MVFLALTPLLASAAGTVRIRRAYVKLSDHLLHLEFYVKPGILGYVLIYLDEELWDVIPTKAHLNPHYHLTYVAMMHWEEVEIYVVDMEGAIVGYDRDFIDYILVPHLPIILHL